MTGEIVILDGARTAIGTFGGSLAAIPPIALAATAAREALARAGVEGGQIGQVVFGHVINTEPRDMYLSRGGGDGGGRAGQRAGDEREPALRVRGAGDRLLRAGACPGGRGLRAGRRGGEHVALALCPDGGALGAEDGRRDRGGHDGRRAHLPVRDRTHGRHRRERGGGEPDHPRGAGRLRGGKPEPGGGGDPGRAVRGAGGAGRGDGEAGEGGLRHRRAPEGDHGRGARQAAAGIPEGRHGHRRQRQRTERRGGGGRAGDGGGGGEGRAEAEGAGAGLCGGRGPARGDGDRADPGGAEAAREDRASPSRTSTSSN